MTQVYEECRSENRDVCRHIKYKGINYIFEVKFNKRDNPLLIDSDKMEFKLVQKEEKITKWDYIQTFRPPLHLSIESNHIFEIVKLPETSPDFEHVSKAFLDTFGGQVARGGGGIFGNPLSIIGNPVPGFNPPPVGFGRPRKAPPKMAYLPPN